MVFSRFVLLFLFIYLFWDECFKTIRNIIIKSMWYGDVRPLPVRPVRRRVRVAGGARRRARWYRLWRAGTATGRKGSMWAAVPAGAGDALAADGDVPLGPGQLPPRYAHLAPLHAEINISIIMIKGQLELEVSTAYHSFRCS